MFLVVVPKGMVEVFGVITHSKDVNLCLKLDLDNKVKVNENITNLDFFFQQIHPTYSSMIINKFNKPYRVGMIRSKRKSPHITMN